MLEFTKAFFGGDKKVIKAVNSITYDIKGGDPLPVEIKRRVKSGELNYYAVMFIEEALKFGVDVKYYSGHDVYRFQKGKKISLKYGMRFDLNSATAAYISENKAATNAILQEKSLPVPFGMILTQSDYQSNKCVFEDIKYPIVVKPATGTSGGDGVVTRITDEKSLRKILDTSLKLYDKVLIEKSYADYDEYRVTILDDEVLGITKKMSPIVVGDGQSTIEQLIKGANQEKQELARTKMVYRLPQDEDVQKYIKNQGFKLNSILKRGQKVVLTDRRNLHLGGEVEHIYKKLPSNLFQMCLTAMDVLRMRLCGIDILAKDLFTEPFEGVFLELNFHPGLSVHCQNNNRKRREIYRKIITALFK